VTNNEQSRFFFSCDTQLLCRKFQLKIVLAMIHLFSISTRNMHLFQNLLCIVILRNWYLLYTEIYTLQDNLNGAQRDFAPIQNLN
jgi:hypothetical protein